MQLSIIIVNYNVKSFLEQCLYSVIRSISNIEAEIFVVDNNSSDGSEFFFKDKFEAVKFIWNKINAGFAKANNAAFMQATGKYILFLNPDTIVPEDCFEKCISFLESNTAAGALGVRMIDGKGNFLKESKRSFPSPLTAFYKLAGLAEFYPKSKTFAKYHLGNLNENENHEVDVLAGAFLMTSKKVLEQTGSFDEAFFMYGEDIDLSYRIQKAGFKNFYFAETTIIHFKGESTKKGSLNYVKMFYKAMSVFVKKHYGKSKAGIFNFLIQFAIFFRAMISIAGRFAKWILFSLRKQIVKKGKEEISQAIVTGAKEELEEVKSILKITGRNQNRFYLLDVRSVGSSGIDEYIKQLNGFIKIKPIGEIILCQGKLSFKHIIEVTEKLPKSLKIKFHSIGSKSIIGSDYNSGKHYEKSMV